MSIGEPQVVRAACAHDCPDTCAMLVTVQDGVATGVRGDPEHPFTRGGLCVKVHDYERRVYSPDRVLHPLRRVGPKGEGRFERIGWDEAVEEICERLRSVKAQYGGQAILPYSYLGTEGLLNGLSVGDPFFHRLGASVSERTFCDSGSCTAYFMTIGPTAGMDPESFVHSRFILLWACNVQSTNLHMWPFIREAQRRGAKVVVIDPVRTRTAAQADWYIPIRPGTDAALALGLMHVIIAEGLTDADYVQRHTVGFGELAERVREYTPARVEEITGVPAADVVELARQYAGTQPSAIRIGVAIERHAGGGQAVRSIASLPALVGAWRRVGGGLLQLPLWAFPVNWDGLMRPDWIESGTRVINQYRLGPALTGKLELDPPVKALFVYNSNPAIVASEQRKVLEGLSREDLFTVVGEHFVSDTARYADIVLPNTTQLEQFDLMFSWGHFYLSLNAPAIEPLGEAVPNREMFRRLAVGMGFDDEIFGLTDEEMALLALDWSSPALEGNTLDLLKERGWARLKVGSPDEYAPHADGAFPTPSGKCEFRSSMAEGGDFVVPVFREGYGEHQPGDPVDPLPHYVPVNELGADPRYPLALLSPKSHAYLNSQYANMDRQRRRQGPQDLMMHPADARARHIGDGEPVRVLNDRGELQAVARLTENVLPGVVVCTLGHWRSGPGSATVNALTPPAFADLGRAPTFSDNAVEVAPVVP
jgi:anaerobic selenocysteine-containing dehydrogenase